VSRIFKMSIGANLKLLKKIDEKLKEVVRQESNHQWVIVASETEIENERYKLAVELQECIKYWKRDIGYEEGLKEIEALNEDSDS